MADNINELAGRLVQAIDTLSAPAANIALEAARIEAYSHFMGGVIAFIIGLVLVFFSNKFWKKYKENKYENEGSSVIGFVGFVLSGFFFIGTAMTFLDPWLWITISNPELFLAKKVLGF